MDRFFAEAFIDRILIFEDDEPKVRNTLTRRGRLGLGNALAADADLGNLGKNSARLTSGQHKLTRATGHSERWLVRIH